MTRSSIPTRAAGIVLALAGLGVAGWLAPQIVQANLQRSCLVADSPYFRLCPDLPAAQQRMEDLRTHIDRNPGDSSAYLRLALADSTGSRPNSIKAAVQLAPTNPNMQALVATAALERGDFPSAVAALVDLAERGSDRAAAVLARLVASGKTDLLLSYVYAGTTWLPRVLFHLPTTQGTFSAALPLVTLAIDKQAMQPEELKPYVRQLKNLGAWADAYSVWVAMHRRTLPLLYNGSFDQPFQQDGFDWEVTSQHPIARIGAIIDRRQEDGHGIVLDIRFTGRPIELPMIRQSVLVDKGRYRLQGQFKSAQLRMEKGLAWTVRCGEKNNVMAQSEAMTDTANAWQPFQFDFWVPADCGWVARLQLETVTPVEATLGSRGRASFDALSLEKVSL